MGHDLNGFATRLLGALLLEFLIQWRRSSTDGIIGKDRKDKDSITGLFGERVAHHSTVEWLAHLTWFLATTAAADL